MRVGEVRPLLRLPMPIRQPREGGRPSTLRMGTLASGRCAAMSISDIRGVPTSTSNGASLDGFERALRQFQGYEGDPVATIDETLREDPSFTLGHCLRAVLHILATEKAAVQEVSRSVAAAEALAGTATGRERGHIAAAR